MIPNRNDSPAFRPRRLLPLALLAAGLALAGAMVAGQGRFRAADEAYAQETDLPSVPVDSVGETFLQGSRAPAAPGTPAIPAPPPAPGSPWPADSPDQAELKRQLHIESGKNDVVQVGEDIVVEPGQHVLGHVLAIGGNITVRGTVDDDVVALGGDVRVENGAQVRGDAVSVGGAVHKDPTATVLGSTVSVGGVPRGAFTWRGLNAVGHGVKFMTRLFGVLFWALIAWLVVLLAAARTGRVAARIEQQTLAAFGWGLLAVVAVVPATITVAFAAVLLVITIIGIPVAALLLLGYIVALAVLVLWGAVAGATAVGAWLTQRMSPRLGPPSLMRHALVGVVALALPGLAAELLHVMGGILWPIHMLGTLVGVLGKVLGLGVLCAGIGAILMTRAGQPAPLPASYGGPGVGYPPPSAPVMPPPPAGPPPATPPPPPPAAGESPGPAPAP